LHPSVAKGGGGRAEPARPPLNPPLISNLELQRYVLGVMYKIVLFLTCLHIVINFSFDIAYLAKYVCCRFFLTAVSVENENAVVT